MSLSLRLVLAFVLLTGWAGMVPADQAAAPDYGERVQPIFQKYCVGCHNGTDREGELVLEKFADLMAGGADGAVVVPGKADDSLIVQVLTGKSDTVMPPEDNEKPTADEIATLIAWINAGAKAPQKPGPDPANIVVPKITPHGDVHEAVTAVAFAPDGKTLAVARLGTIELLSMPERTLLRRLGPHHGRINALSFSQDGATLAAAAGQPGVFGEARLWNVASGKPAGTFKGHTDSLYAAALSPDGKLLATSSYDQQIKLWDVAGGNELRSLSGHNDAVFDLAFRPDGKILASASGDRTAKLWDVASGERLETFGQPTKELYCVAFSPDGTRVAAGGVDNRIRVWRVSADGKENTNPLLYARFAHEGPVVNLVYSADGKTMVSAGEDHTVKIWDADKMVERLLLERQSDWAPALAISPDGKVVAVGRLDGSLAFYDTAKGEIVPTPPPPKPDLASISSRGLQSGATTRLTFRGKHLAEATAVKGSDKRIAAKIVAAPDGTRLQFDVTPAADLPRGRYELWAVSAGGDSQHMRVYVDDLKQMTEAEPNDALAEANPTSLETDVWGKLAKKGDVDSFAFDARAGQKLVFDVTSTSIGGKGNLVLTLFDAKGRVLADNNDFGGTSDPLLEFTIPSDGRYVIQAGDLMLDGGGDYFYRLALGELAVPTGVFPLSVPANTETEVEVIGPNVPEGLKVKVPAAPDGEVTVPIDAAAYRIRQPLKVAVGALPETLEAESNDTPQTATPISAPATVGGRIHASAAGVEDNDYFRFESKKGGSWIVETDAAGRGSPVDTVVEVLTAEGKPIERVLLQAVRDSNVTFRPIDSNIAECRLVNWEEMQLNQLLYLNGEVVKLFRSPRGPDSGFRFYEGDGGKRMGYYDTTATAHAVEEPCFIVRAYAPGTKLISTGLPVFPVYFTNDDDGLRRLGTDSRLTFTAPADGAYLVRVRDSRGHGGDRYAYRLTVRPPAPDFNVTIRNGDKVPAGSGDQFTVSVDRIDGFDDEVRVDIANVPEGFRVSTPIVIQAGHRDAQGVMFAELDAKQPDAEALQKLEVTATAAVDGKEVAKPVKAFDKLKLLEKPKLLVRLEPAELTVAPGGIIPATIKVERNGFDDLVKFEVENLPHGVIVADIGLSGVMLPKGATERQIFIQADPWVPETTRLCFAVDQQAGGQCSPPVVIHVRKDSPVAQAGK